MGIGLLKSKVERLLSESYSKNTFKTEIQNFKKNILENKSIAKIFFLYDELTSNKGMDQSMVDEFISECKTQYTKEFSLIDRSKFNLLNEWVKDIKCENLYSNIDDMFSDNILTMESRINSKKIISETLKKQPEVNKDVTKVPINSMISIANRTITNHINSLDESDKKELYNLLSQDDETLKSKFNTLKESVIDKLNVLKSGSTDNETGDRITETIQKVTNEKYDKLTYFKLKSLHDNL